MPYEAIPPRDVSWYGDPRDHAARCDLCPLAGNTFVPYAAPTKKHRLTIVGEGPGRKELIRRTPFCLVPETPILMADLTWKPLDEVQVGEQIITVQEEPDRTGEGVSGHAMRNWRFATVLNRWDREADTLTIEMASGRSLIGTPDHRVLASSATGNRRWLEMSGLHAREAVNVGRKKVRFGKRNSRVTSVGAPWVQDNSREAGWLAGFLDGEGHVMGSKRDVEMMRKARKRRGVVGFSQNLGPVADYAESAVLRLGFKFRAHEEQRSYSGNTIRRSHLAGGFVENMRFLGRIRPIRLLRDFLSVLDGVGMRNLDADEVLKKYPSGKRRVIDIQTSEGTFIANGYVVHNCGQTGEILNEQLEEVGVDREACHVTNATLCLGETDEENEIAAACCAPRLLKEISALDPKAPIVALGKAAAKSVLAVNSILLSRGFIWTARDLTDSIKAAEAAVRKAKKKYDAGGTTEEEAMAEADLRLLTVQERHKLAGRIVIPTLHPTFAFIHNEGWAPIFKIDLDRAARVMRGEVDLNRLADYAERVDSIEKLKKGRDVYVVTDSPKDIRRLSNILGQEVACDIETERAKPLSPLTAKILCVQISDGTRSFVISPWDAKLHVKPLTEFFKGRTVVFHNGYNFDQPALETAGASFEDVTLEDTLVAHHSFMSHVPQKLDHVVATFLDSSPWKIKFGVRSTEEKGLIPVHSDEDELAAYGVADAVVTIKAWRAMQADLAGERAVYEHDKLLGIQGKGMQVVGFHVDLERKEELRRGLVEHADALKAKMRGIVRRRNLQPSKHADVRKALFRILKAPVLNPTSKGLPSTANATLEALRTGGAGSIRKGPGDVKRTTGPINNETIDTRIGQFAESVLHWRVAEKIRATYLDAVQIHSDGRAHFNWRPYGTVSGRYSCRQQSNPRWSKKIEDRPREIYAAPEGFVLTYFDLSQAEMRMAAALSGDPVFMKTCEGDVHTGNAKILFPDARAQECLTRDPKGDKCPQHAKGASGAGECNCGKPFRDIAKNAGFAVSYLAEAPTVFAYLRAHGFPVEADAVDYMLASLKSAYRRYYEYVAENVAFVERNGYLRTPIVGRIRWFGFHPKPTDVANCLDYETEALTPEGWVRGPDLQPGQKLLTKNAETGAMSWEPIARMYRFPDYSGETYEFKSRSFNAVSTPEHRWLVRDRKTGLDRCATSAELAKGTGELSIHRTGKYEAPSAKIYTDEFVELVGWVLTDGSILTKKSPTVCVYQTKRANVRRIDALFARLGGGVSRDVRKSHGQDRVIWRLTARTSLAQEMIRLFPDRTLSWAFMLSLTGDQLTLIRETMMLGDGSVVGSHRGRFCCRDAPRKDAFQALCTLGGIATTARWRGPTRPKKQYATIANRPRSQGIWVISLLHRDKVQVIRHPRRYGLGKNRVDQVRVLDGRPVWCPVVPNTYFVARRRGDVFITGNTPIQSGIADTMNTRLLELQRKVPKSIRLVAQIHDASIWETPIELKDYMRNEIVELWKRPVHIPKSDVCGKAIDLLLPADIKVGQRWNEFG